MFPGRQSGSFLLFRFIGNRRQCSVVCVLAGQVVIFLAAEIAGTEQLVERMTAFRGGFNVSKQHLVFLERWSVSHGVSEADIFLGEAEGGDMGSMAGRSVDEFDWTYL